MMNSPRTSEDPGDATDDDARHPDEPTEPPDDAESARVRGGQRRVEVDVSRMSRGRADETVGSDSTTGARTKSEGDEDGPGNPKNAPDDVEPGGETNAERSGRVAREIADARVDKEGVRTHGDAQLDRESTGAHRDVERAAGSASAHIRSTRRDEENRQRTSTDKYDAPKDPPDPFPPPDRPARIENEPLSAELEGEWKVPASRNAGPTADKTDPSGVSKGDEDPRNRPKVAQNASECEREHSKGRTRQNSPKGGRDDPGDPGGEAHALGASGRIEDVGKRPRKLRNASKCAGERLERKGPEDSPERARGELDDPGSETLVPGSAQSDQEGPEGV